MLATAENMHHSPTQGSNCDADTFTPAKPQKELKRYHVRLHFPELKVGKVTIPAGVDDDTVWATNKFDAIRYTAKRYKAASRVEVIR